MAHNLNFENGSYSFAKKGELAWHKLGQYVDKAMTTEEAIKLAHLDYNVELIPLCGQYEGNDICFPRYKGVVRTDNNVGLGIVGNKYRPLQNHEAFLFLDELVGSGEAIIETAGALGKGEVIFISAKFPSFISVKDEDIENYFLITHAHDGSAAITIRFTSVCVVCNNTLTAALRGMNNRISIKHTLNAKNNMLKGAKLLGIKNQFEIDLDNLASELAANKVNDNTAKEYFGDVFYPNEPITPHKNQLLKQVFENYKEGLGSSLEARKDTAWGLVNAVSGYYQNIKQYKEDGQLKSILGGKTEKTINKALELALKL